jgi:hypothetical protein
MLGRIARDVGYLVAAVVGWVLLFLLIAAMYVGASYAFSGHPPFCWPALPGWVPPAGALDLDFLFLIAVPAATLLVGLWWALGAEWPVARGRRIVGVVAATVLVLFALGLAATVVLTPFTCPVVV